MLHAISSFILVLAQGSSTEESMAVLDKEYEAFVTEWLGAGGGATEESLHEFSLQMRELFPRYRRMAVQGDPDAVLWVLRNATDDHFPHVFALTSVIMEGDDPWWMTECACLILHRFVEEEDLISFFGTMAGMPGFSREKRAVGLLGKAEYYDARGKALYAHELRWRALFGSLGHEYASRNQENAEALFQRALRRIQEERESWSRVSLREIDGETHLLPNAPPTPEQNWASRMGTLAKYGSPGAALWMESMEAAGQAKAPNSLAGDSKE